MKETTACSHSLSAGERPRVDAGGRCVDAEARGCRRQRQREQPLSRRNLEASDGLEPSTPSLPSTGLFLKKGRLSSRQPVDVTSSDAPGRDAHLFLGAGRTPCRWELSRFLSSIKGRQAAKAKWELAGTEVPLVVRGAGLKGWLRESMCQAAIRILRATAALAELLWRERRPTST